MKKVVILLVIVVFIISFILGFFRLNLWSLYSLCTTYCVQSLSRGSIDPGYLKTKIRESSVQITLQQAHRPKVKNVCSSRCRRENRLQKSGGLLQEWVSLLPESEAGVQQVPKIWEAEERGLRGGRYNP